MRAVKITLPLRTVRRLFAAEGYLELGMPDHALAELKEIEDSAPVEASVQFLTGEAYRQQQRYEEAIGPLEKATRLIPAPHNKVVWLSLSDCFRRSGHEDLAEMAEMFAQDAAALEESGAFDDEDLDIEDDDIDEIEPGHDRFS